MKKWWMGAVALVLLMALSGCDAITGSSSSNDKKKKTDGTGGTIEVIGTSGDVVDMDGSWNRFEGACYEDNGQGGLSPRVFAGDQLTMSIDNWLTDLTCAGGSDTSVVFVFTLTVDKQVTGIIWVDSNSAVADAPAADLEGVDANGVSYTLDTATATANTDAGAADWVDNTYCGFTDWAAGTEHDAMDCFLTDVFGGENPFKGSMVVDDTTDSANPAWYDYTSGADTDEDGNPDVDGDGYPLTIENFDPITKQ